MKVFEIPEIEIKKFDVMDAITSGDGNMGGEGGYDSGEEL